MAASSPHPDPAADLPVLPALPGDPCLRNRCSACCHGTEMLLTEADLERLTTARPGEAFWHEEDGYRLLRTVGDEVDAPCWFLGDDGRCTVHDARPEGCRLYPLVWDVDAEAAVLDSDHCPYTQEFRPARRHKDAVGRLADRLERERDERIRRDGDAAKRS